MGFILLAICNLALAQMVPPETFIPPTPPSLKNFLPPRITQKSSPTVNLENNSRITNISIWENDFNSDELEYLQRLIDADFYITADDIQQLINEKNPIHRRVKLIASKNEFVPNFNDTPKFMGLSSNAIDLIWVHLPKYYPYGPHPAPIIPDFPPVSLNNDFAVEEYRNAWEELYLDSVVNGTQNNNIRFVPDDISTSAIGKIASTNSIPFLHDLYVVGLNEKKDGMQQRQNEMLRMLLCIDTPEALDTVFSLLDLTESKTGTEAAATLREGLVKDLARTLEKSETFNAYKNPSLSEKNKAFLEAARKEEKKEVVQ